jgi:hypothetical protein
MKCAVRIDRPYRAEGVGPLAGKRTWTSRRHGLVCTDQRDGDACGNNSERTS